MVTTNTPTYEQLIAAKLDPAQIERPIVLKYWQCALLYNPNFPDRSPNFVKRVKAHLPIKHGWTTPKPITDRDGWGGDHIPWYPGVYRLQRWWDNKPLSVKTKSGEDDPRGIICIRRNGTWLKAGVQSLRRTYFEGIKHDHYPLSPENQVRYPKEQLAISWLGCFDWTIAKAVEGLLIRQYNPIHNKSRLLSDKELKCWTDNHPDIEDALAAEYLGGIRWMEASLAWRRKIGDIS
jgi:hypothetical protein